MTVIEEEPKAQSHVGRSIRRKKLQTIEIIQESPDWLVLDKPPGISVHNKLGSDLISFVKERYPETDKAFLINRLDSGTSGLVLFARHSKSARSLQQSFEKREVSKTYIARVEVLKNPPTVGDSGLWRWPLTNRAENRGDPRGYWGKRIPCQTQWEVLSVSGETAILKLLLLTGRKHQIRRHSAIHGWPVCGDPRYGPQAVESVGGHSLIAHELVFNDPESGEAVTVRSKFQLDA